MQKIQKTKSLFKTFAHQNDSRFSFIFSNNDLNLYCDQYRFNEVYENRQFRFIQRDQLQRQRNRFKSRIEFMSSTKFENFRDLVLAKTKQFKISNIDFFYFYYFENKNLNEYIVSDKKIIYINVQIFIQIIKRYTIIKNVVDNLHLCFRNSIQIWFISQNKFKQQILLANAKAFCNVFLNRYENHFFDFYNKFYAKRYTIRNAQQKRQSNEYIDNFMRHVVSLAILDLIVLIVVWNSFDKNIKRHVRKFDKRTIFEKFTKNLKKAINYWVFSNIKKNQMKAIY